MKTIFILCCLTCMVLSSAAQLHDDFTDVNFTSDPEWTGDVSEFEVNSDEQLHLNAPAVTDTAYISTMNSLISNIEWDFYFKMDFSPSGGNYLKAYLVSDQPDLNKPLNGYFLKMGEEGSDDAIELYLQQGNAETLIFSGIPGNVSLSVNTVSIKVTRDSLGNWMIYSDINGGTNYVTEAGGFENSITITSYFGFSCKYTSSRSTAFYFDDVYVGEPVVDTEPPMISQVSATGSFGADVYFNESVEQLTAEDEINYTVDNGIGNPSFSLMDTTDPKLVHLIFSNPFQNGITNTINISHVTDHSGNSINDGSSTFVFYAAQKNDVVISEIMADPEPVNGLPDAEFVELYNQSAFPIDLTGWTFSDGGTPQTIPSHILQPNNFLILCDDGDLDLFLSFGDAVGLNSFPSLNNDGDALMLMNNLGSVINSADYTSDWYHDEIKSSGGFTLEMIDPANPCQGITNWTASSDAAGGTPGKINSVSGANPDTTAPQLIHVSIAGSAFLQLDFNERLDSAIAADISHYAIDPMISISAASVVSPDFTTVNLFLSENIDSNKIFIITVNDIADCSGNVMDSSNIADFASPSFISSGEIIINEILFNPVSGGYDYVELYNHSDKIFDLKNLHTATTSDGDSVTGINDITDQGFLFFPGQYAVLTGNAEWLQQHYNVRNREMIIEASLPSLNDDEGVIVLLNDSAEWIDALHYFESWQFPLINDVEGVALERIHFDTPTQDSMNWHSAAEGFRFGTPTYINSQFDQAGTGDEITLSPQVFSPDQDGFNDILNISYQFSQTGFIANIRIYDPEGRMVTDLVHNNLLAQSGIFTWDGITDKNEKASIGLYIIYTEIFDLSGKVKHYKNVCAIGGKRS